LGTAKIEERSMTGQDNDILHYVFTSYTTREEEFQQVEDFIDAMIEELDRRGLKKEVVKYIWLDRLMIDRYGTIGKTEMEEILKGGINDSGKMLAFVSPKYWPSEWCRLEWTYANDRMPVGNIAWKGSDPVKWWFPPADRSTCLDARPLLHIETYEYGGPRILQDRLPEYVLFRSLVDEIYNFLVGNRVYETRPEVLKRIIASG
jgi:hypothetical protein